MEVKELSKKLGISEILSNILINRGFSNIDEASKFLGLSPQEKINPFDIYGIKDAVYKIKEHLDKGTKITIYGDYDVDGITGGSVYYEYLSMHSNNVHYYMPHRIEDGYGINTTSLEKISKDGTDLVLTVDNGITRYDVAELAKKLKLDLVITDHHELGEKLPDCIVVNTKINNQIPYLAGVGVAFLVCSAIEKIMPTGKLGQLLDLVALGTIADVVPLIHINRTLVRMGLNTINSRKRIGLSQLIKKNNLMNKVRTSDVGFKLAPCLNAAGRIDRADQGVRLLTSKDYDEAQSIASKLIIINEKRKDLSAEINDKIENFIHQNKIDTSKPIIYCGEEDHAGVLGVAAARIMEKYNVPVLVLSKITKENNIIAYSGSGRAPEGFHLAQSIQENSSLVLAGGGHACAAGVTITQENIKQFSQLFIDSLLANQDKSKKSELKVDQEIKLSELNDNLMEELELFQPTGKGNPEINFLSTVKIESKKEFKTGTGFSLKVSDENGNMFRCMAFKMNKDFENININDYVKIIYTPEYNSFPPGSPEIIQLRIKKFVY